ncbi:MAG TPA: alpha amylase C-terminal domain-containing protein [Verrucomicrobiae bacterium]|nr:alpha amylase C-terminal domain-containing protein [Verrucomicrobiae bacterium]
MSDLESRLSRLLRSDSYLAPFSDLIQRRLVRIEETEHRLTQGKMSLADFASGHEYFGLHFQRGEWVFREWAPNATGIYLIGDMSKWQERREFELEKISDDGVWEIHLTADKLAHGDLFRLRIHWASGEGDRIPAYARRVVQDPKTLIFNAQVWLPPEAYRWKIDFKPPKEAPLIYEAHVGMAQEEEKIGSFREFTFGVLPRIVNAGYNTLQLMAIQEHPYYGSFGYQVSSFFAPSSRYGTPEDLKLLIDVAHAQGLSVFMDLIHSHSVSNEVEGLSRFDGTTFQYFHEGARGKHAAWDSRLFDYGKTQVLHFLLSNCRYWLDEFHFDGFRFDGVTSMLYLKHGLRREFTTYNDYFDSDVDEDALTYLALANRVTHDVKPDGATIAEDVSGMPGLAAPQSEGGFGFDYRFAMGVPDYWIRLVKDYKDEEWPIDHLWFELTNRRPDEKTISYAESHDQALVGDQTLIFRLIGGDMYNHMLIDDDNPKVARGIALHKMIRLITLGTAGNGYLNFMGNEFGHPDWIDFPREGNNWSFKHACRQWHLTDDVNLKYNLLSRFDRDMIALAKTHHLLETSIPELLHEDSAKKVIIFERTDLIFAFNFNPVQSFADYRFEAPPGKYVMILDCDAPKYGGYGRLFPQQTHFTMVDKAEAKSRNVLSIYLPARSAFVLCPT